MVVTTPPPAWVAREIKPEISVKSLRVDPYFAILLGSPHRAENCWIYAQRDEGFITPHKLPRRFRGLPVPAQKLQFAIWTLDQLQDRAIGENLAAGGHRGFVRLMIGYDRALALHFRCRILDFPARSHHDYALDSPSRLDSTACLFYSNSKLQKSYRLLFSSYVPVVFA